MKKRYLWMSAALPFLLLGPGCETRPGLKPPAMDAKVIGFETDAARTGHVDTFTFRDLDQPLRQLKFVNPRYPGHLLVRGAAGNVSVKFVINEEGHVQDVSILKATHPDFAEAAVSAVSQWEFSRPTRKGKPIKITVGQELPFVPQ